MDICPQSLSWLCELSGRIPSFTRDEIVGFILGTLVVTFFAIDHYKVPTYAKTTIGDFIELAPESLTSTSRYRKGLYIYIILMFGLYLIFCFLWSQGLVSFLSSFGAKVENTQIWPLAAATAVTLLGTAGDRNPLGRVEATLRSIAHESAYIPEAVLNLSTALNGSFAITEETAEQLGESNPNLLTQIKQSQDGSFQTWIRARYLFSRLGLLRNDADFQQLVNRPENVRAFNFLNEEHQTLMTRVAERLQANCEDLDDTLKKKVENFRNAVSMFLASVLWQSAGTETAIYNKLGKLQLTINPANQPLSWKLLARILAAVGAAAIAAFLLFHLLNWQFHGYLSNHSWQLTLAFLVYVMTALLVTKRRESRLIDGKSERILDASLGAAFFCGLPIGLVAAVTTFALYQGGLARFWAMFWTGLALSISAAFLFEVIMRWAAQSPPTASALRQGVGPDRSVRIELRGLVVHSVLLYAMVAAVAAFVMFWLGQQLVVSGAPAEAAKEAHIALTKVMAGWLRRDVDNKINDDNKVKGKVLNVSLTNLNALQVAVKSVLQKIESNDVDAEVIAGLTRACDEANKAIGGRLFLKDCVFNEEFTREFGDVGEWLNDLRRAASQTQGLVINLEQMRHYQTIPSAIALDWPRAVFATGIWACIAAVFAGSILLQRRSVLWDGVDRKILSEYVADLGREPEAWLRTPVWELNNLTPLEALRYHDLRATPPGSPRSRRWRCP